jgi:hypothetical protein
MEIIFAGTCLTFKERVINPADFLSSSKSYIFFSPLDKPSSKTLLEAITLSFSKLLSHISICILFSRWSA